MQDSTSPDIKKIIAACLREEKLAQKALYQWLYGKLLPITLRYSIDSEEAKSILNLAFLKIFKELPNFDTRYELLPWAKKITLYTTIDQIRKRTTYRKHVKQIKDSDGYCSVALNDALSSLSIQEIFNCIQKLPDSNRTVFCLVEVEGYNHKEIAEMLQISEGTSRWHLSEAKRKLRTMLSPFFEYTTINAA